MTTLTGIQFQTMHVILLLKSNYQTVKFIFNDNDLLGNNDKQL